MCSPTIKLARAFLLERLISEVTALLALKTSGQARSHVLPFQTAFQTGHQTFGHKNREVD